MKKRNFSAEFKRESAQLVVDQNYTVADAAKAMDVGLAASDETACHRWPYPAPHSGRSTHD